MCRGFIVSSDIYIMKLSVVFVMKVVSWVIKLIVL